MISVQNPSYRDSHTAPGHGAHYDQILYSPGAYDAAIWQIEQDILARIFDRHFPDGIPSALDFACGTGRITSLLVSRARRLTGVDVSEEMLSEARKKLPQVRFVCGDITRDPSLLSDHAPFDCVTAFRFFLNAEPVLREEAVRALAQLTQPGGLLICNNHGNIVSLWFFVLMIRHWLGKPPQIGLPYPALLRLLAAQGFRVLEIHGVCFLPRGLCRILPQWLWTRVERALGRLRIFNRFAIYQIYVAERLL